jgi:hypothetical protein
MSVRAKAAFAAVLVVLLLGCVILPPPKPEVKQNGGVQGNVSVEEIAAQERALAAFKEVAGKRAQLAYKAVYFSSSGNQSSEQTWYVKQPTQKVEDRLSPNSRIMVLEDGAASYRCDADELDEVCFRMPAGSIEMLRPETLRHELAAVRSPDLFKVLLAGSAPSSVGELAAQCFTLISTGSKMIACYTAEGVPSYIKLEGAGAVSETMLRATSPASDSDFAPPAQIQQELPGAG